MRRADRPQRTQQRRGPPDPEGRGWLRRAWGLSAAALPHLHQVCVGPTAAAAADFPGDTGYLPVSGSVGSCVRPGAAQRAARRGRQTGQYPAQSTKKGRPASRCCRRRACGVRRTPRGTKAGRLARRSRCHRRTACWMPRPVCVVRCAESASAAWRELSPQSRAAAQAARARTATVQSGQREQPCTGGWAAMSVWRRLAAGLCQPELPLLAAVPRRPSNTLNKVSSAPACR